MPLISPRSPAHFIDTSPILSVCSFYILRGWSTMRGLVLDQACLTVALFPTHVTISLFQLRILEPPFTKRYKTDRSEFSAKSTANYIRISHLSSPWKGGIFSTKSAHNEHHNQHNDTLCIKSTPCIAPRRANTPVYVTSYFRSEESDVGRDTRKSCIPPSGWEKFCRERRARTKLFGRLGPFGSESGWEWEIEPRDGDGGGC
jgi:hypothetical protein